MLINLDTHRARRVTTLFLAVSALYLFAGNASAAEQAQYASKVSEAKGFLVIDASGDGYIDAKEAGANQDLLKIFDAVDTDKDGRISMEEYNKGFAMRQ